VDIQSWQGINFEYPPKKRFFAAIAAQLLLPLLEPLVYTLV
jgi:hypothetical protein